MMLINSVFFRAALRFEPDVVHCNDLNSLLAGFMLKRRLDIPLAYDAHEVYPEQFPPHRRSATWHSFYSELERRLLPHTDFRMTVCDSIGDHYVERHASAPWVTVRNTPSRALLPPESVLSRRNEPRVALYHGAYFEHRGLDEVIRAAPTVDGVRFVFRGMGYHEPALRALAERMGVSGRVEFAAPVPMTELVPLAARCDVGLNPFISNCLNTQFALPNKFFEYMMAGLALASSDLVEMRRLTKQLDIGILFDSESPEAIAGGLRNVLADPHGLDTLRRNAYLRARDEYNWETEQERMLRAYQPLLTGR